MDQRSKDERWMRLALTLAQRGLGRVWPNPAVGCVLVKDDRVVGRGWTQPGGRPHAEAMALLQAGSNARGATAYVTLEPCAHYGKTPPCAEALIKAGVARVVSAIADPDDRVSGKGLSLLKEAGIAVTEGVLPDLAQDINIGFLNRITKSRPMVTLKLASSLDGRIATKTGDSRWITGPESRRAVHVMRATHDAILIGSGTSIADDPDLTVRGLGMENQSPVRVVLDTSLTTTPDSRLGLSAGDVPVWMIHGASANTSKWQSTDALLLPCQTGQTGHVDPDEALTILAAKGLTRIFCEGGGTLAAALLRAGLVDRLVTFSAGVAIGSDGHAMLGELGLTQLASAPRFERASTEITGDDVVSVWHAI